MLENPLAHGNSDDVRMRGFSRRATVASALEWLDRQLAAARDAGAHRGAERITRRDIETDGGGGELVLPRDQQRRGDARNGLRS